MSAQSHRDGYLPFWRRFREINLATLERAAGTPLSYATAELICQALFQFHGESEHTSRLSNTKLRRDELKNVTTHCDRAADALRLLEPGAAAELSQDFRDFRAENCRSRASHAATWAEEMAKLLAQISTKATQQLLDVKPRERKKSAGGAGRCGSRTDPPWRPLRGGEAPEAPRFLVRRPRKSASAREPSPTPEKRPRREVGL